MRARLIIMAGLATFATHAAPSAAQQGTRVLTIFGNDKCPTSNGEEIVVCTRLPEGDRFRIPENLRTTNDRAPAAQRRVDAMQQAGNAGIGSCSASGPGGMTGCQLQEIRNARAERRQAAAAAAPVVE